MERHERPALFDNRHPLDAEATELPPDKNQLFMQHSPEGPVGHFEVRNLYGHQMSRATWEGLQALRPTERPFVLTRAGLCRHSALCCRLAGRQYVLVGTPFPQHSDAGKHGAIRRALLRRRPRRLWA